MATPISNTVISLTAIDGTDCLGDSRAVINSNITTIGTSISSLTLNSTTLSTTVTNLNLLLLGNTNTLSAAITGINTSFNTSNIGLSTTLTTYVSSLSVYFPNGSYIGFIPIYN